MPEFNRFPFEIQKQRDQLAERVKGTRKQSAEKRKESKDLKSRITGKSDQLSEQADALKEKAVGQLERGKEAIQVALERYQSGIDDLESVGTDHGLIRWYYKKFRNQEVYPVATDSFIDKSRDEYNAAWLSRELVQNFIDHNPQAPGTLNGVVVKREVLADGKTKFTVTGEWSFPDPTGIISPHSEKPADTNTAGGNGIGLKQTAIRYLRDFGVNKFEIHGENWVANYELANAGAMNKDIEKTFEKSKAPNTRKMRHDWLIADLKANGEHGRNSYIIETDNPEVIAALDQFEELGVCEGNKYLQNPDFKNNKGAIKWLPPVEGKAPRGRLFINVQVMNYGSKGKTAQDYWVGPEYVTIQLNNTAYKMSIDRPPVQSYELGMYLSHLIQSMTVEQTLDQLKASESIWSADVDERSGAMVLVQGLVRNLQFNSKYKKEEFSKIFGDKKYLATDHSLTKAQADDLRKQGYTLCPNFFESLGTPRASSKLSNLEMATNQKPDSYRANTGLEKIAEESGIQVAYEDLSKLKPEQLITAIKERISKNNPEIIFNPEKPNVVRIKLGIDLPKELLSKVLPNPKTNTQKLLYFLRGVAFTGLEKQIFKKIYLAQGEYVTTFDNTFDSALEESTLFVRNLKASSDEGVYIEFELEDEHSNLLKLLKNGEQTTQPIREIPSKQPVVAQGEPQITATTYLEKPDIKKSILVVIKEKGAVLSEAQLDDLEKTIPGIKDAVKKLQEISDKTELSTNGEKSAMEKYKEWRDSAQANQLAEESAGYITGKTIGEIVSAYNQAEIAVAKAISTAGEAEQGALSELKSLKNTLEAAINKMNPDGEVQDFEMVFDPQPRQLAQLGLLRIYAYLTNGVAIQNKLFVFRGTGTTGINMNREAIGIHEKELDQSFLEAVGIFTHELAHNEHMNHDVGFMTAMEALFLETNRRLTEIALKAKNGETLNENEELILSVVQKWDELRNQI